MVVRPSCQWLCDAITCTLCAYIKTERPCDLRANSRTASRYEILCLTGSSIFSSSGLPAGRLGTMPTVSDDDVESELCLVPAPLAPVKRVSITTPLRPSSSTFTKNRDGLRNFYHQKLTIDHAIENAIEEYAGLASVSHSKSSTLSGTKAQSYLRNRKMESLGPLARGLVDAPLPLSKAMARRTVSLENSLLPIQ